jgi:hypothetical protein
MYVTLPDLEAIESARVLLGRIASERLRQHSQRGSGALWASVSNDGRVRVGTPLLDPGEGFYVDLNGQWTEA